MSNVENLVGEWLPLPDVAQLLNVSITRVHGLIDERALVAARVGERKIRSVPAEFLQDGQVVDSLKGTIVVLADAGYSDVVREAQEVVELALKDMLRQAGIEPPKWHDVGGVLAEHRMRFTEPVREQIDRLSEISTRLRKDRELSFNGDIDFVPTDHYAAADASKAIDEARFVVSIAGRAFGSAASDAPKNPLEPPASPDDSG